MKRLLTVALCATSMALASCATTPTSSTETVAQVGSAVDRAQVAYDRIAVAAEVALPFLSPERAARVRLAMSLAERGLLAARHAVSAAEQLAALKQAEAATAAIKTTAGT
jgi:predicted small secreted protein